jgi:hypothetical protein
MELDGFTPCGRRAQQMLAVAEVQAVDRFLAVPDLTFGREADHPRAAKVDQGHDLFPAPFRGDRGAHPEPGCVPHPAPRLAGGEGLERSRQRLPRRDRLASDVVGGDLERQPLWVDRRPEDVAEKSDYP